jgi:hypothetical protein
MRAIWKWILLFIGILVLAFLVALPFFVGRSLGLARMPMMFMFGGRPGFGPAFGGGFGILAGLILFGRFILPLALIVLAAFGLAALLRGQPRLQAAANMAAASTAPAAATDVMQASSAPVEPAAPAEQVATTPCAHCGSPLQTGWVACPYCGEKV